MRKFIAVILVMSCLFLSGCSTFGQVSPDSLLMPPKLSDEQVQVYNALEASVGKNIKLKYPNRGEYTSAYLIENIDSEETNEALVFYESENNATFTKPLRITVIDKNEDIWYATYDVGIEATDVDKVSFVKTADKTIIVIGFNLYTRSEKLVISYVYKNGIMHELFRKKCTNYEVADLDQDGTDEIITLSAVKERDVNASATAEIYAITGESIYSVDTVPINPQITEYQAISFGKTNRGDSALYIDGICNQSAIMTDIITYEVATNSYQSLIYSENKRDDLSDETYRGYGMWCMDIDGDSIYEMPFSYPALGFEETELQQKQYLTDWYNYVMGELVVSKTTFVDYAMGYVFVIPQKWQDKVTVSYDESNNELSFIEYARADEPDSTILSIRPIKRGEYEEKALNEGYSVLFDNGQLLYTYKMYDIDSKLKLRTNQIEDCFLKL